MKAATGKKGKQLYIEGRLTHRKWQDKDGKDQYTTEVVAESVKFLGGGSEREEPRGGSGGGYGGGGRSGGRDPDREQGAPGDGIPF